MVAGCNASLRVSWAVSGRRLALRAKCAGRWRGALEGRAACTVDGWSFRMCRLPTPASNVSLTSRSRMVRRLCSLRQQLGLSVVCGVGPTLQPFHQLFDVHMLIRPCNSGERRLRGDLDMEIPELVIACDMLDHTQELALPQKTLCRPVREAPARARTSVSGLRS